MMRWLLVEAWVGLAVGACVLVFLSLGYRIDWPTLVYAVIAMLVANLVREAA